MKGSSLVSRPGSLICPLCEAGQLRPSGHHSGCCESCGNSMSGAMLKALRQITSLPDALGSHACEECGHPEMRRLPDGTFHCPSCGSEVLPIDATSALSKPDEHGEAYRAGWLDGCFGEVELFTRNRGLARWQSAHDRLDYYRGHREGRQLRIVVKGDSHEEIED